jgi:hypothetical protein
LYVRGRQALAVQFERRDWSRDASEPDEAAILSMLRSPGTPLSAEAVLEQFRCRTSPAFFPSFTQRKQAQAELRHRFPEAESAVLERAEQITRGRFSLLGLNDIQYGDPIDWHLDPLSGERAPRVHWSRIDYLDRRVAGDKKVIWELNRHQYFLRLGQAYWYSDDERFAQTWCLHLTSWMAENPPKIGINWASSLEVSLRAISWLWALYFFGHSPHLTPHLFLQLIKFLWLHARHLEKYLSTYFSPNTHLTGEALGLFYLGLLLPEFRQARRWRDAGARILLAELPRQVRSDGVYFEQASHYHRYTVDFYCHFLILLQANGIAVPPLLEQQLQALLDHLVSITKPDGTTPMYGDEDGGRLAPLDDRPINDCRSALCTGAVLFGRGDYKYISGGPSEETFWLLGGPGLEAFSALPAAMPRVTSRGFTEAGYYVMRDGWCRDANYLMIDCGPHGALSCGHAHADTLSIELAANRRTLICDSGTYTYTGSAPLRDLFRSSAAHNTVTIDEESSSVADGPFRWKDVARSTVRSWISQNRFDYFEGSHDGFRRLDPPAVHARAILFVKSGYWIMRDQILTAGRHRCAVHYHFPPGTTVEHDPKSGSVSLAERRGHLPLLNIFVHAESGGWQESSGWFSPQYGQRIEAPTWHFGSETHGSTCFVSFLVPATAVQRQVRVEEIPAAGGQGFVIQCGSSRDLLLLRDQQNVAAGDIESDFEWTWLRHQDEDDIPKEIILVRGHRLCIHGRVVVDSDALIDSLHLQYRNSEWAAAIEGARGRPSRHRGIPCIKSVEDQ